MKSLNAVLLIIAASFVAASGKATGDAPLPRLFEFGVFPAQPGAWSVFSIDPSTGAYTPVFPAAVPEGPSFAADSQAYDPVGKRWFFLAGGFTPPELYTVNLASNTVAHVPLASCCGRLQYDVVHGRLLELGVFPAQPGALSVFSIDPLTGAYTLVFPAAVTPVTLGPVLDSQAYDPVGQRWFYLNGGFTPPELYTVNLSSNSVTHVPVVSCCGRLQYDVVHGRLLELGVLPAQPGALSVFSIDPLTGAYTLVFPAAVTPVTLGPVADSQAYDPVGQRWFYLNGGFTPPELYTVNLSSNSVIHVPVASCCGRLAYQPDTIALAVPAAQFHVQILLIVILALIGCLVLSKNAFP